jgi:hypothetical protein
MAMIAKAACRVVARVVVAAFVAAQLAVSAYACPVQVGASPIPVAHGAVGSEAGDAPCTGMDHVPLHAQSNACEVHCTDGVTSPGRPDLPPVALATHPAGAVAPADIRVVHTGFCRSIAPVAGAPTLNLRFCRLLI